MCSKKTVEVNVSLNRTKERGMTGTVVVYILVVIVVYFKNAAFRLRKTYPLKKKGKRSLR